MPRRKLIASDEAVPVLKQHTAPCSDCPFARDSLNGWLGRLSVDEWINSVHGEAQIGCHITTNAECAGAAIYRSNVYKRPRDPNALILPPDRVLVFASPAEFQSHHEKNATEA
jgi:hypothetical protein